mgnify:CR=1 FL=1
MMNQTKCVLSAILLLTVSMIGLGCGAEEEKKAQAPVAQTRRTAPPRPTTRTCTGLVLSRPMSMLFCCINRTSSARGMRRNLDPGTLNPCSRPLSKQRMMVCWETLQIFAASPVVNTCLSASDLLVVMTLNLVIGVCVNSLAFPNSPNHPSSPKLRNFTLRVENACKNTTRWILQRYVPRSRLFIGPGCVTLGGFGVLSKLEPPLAVRGTAARVMRGRTARLC